MLRLIRTSFPLLGLFAFAACGSEDTLGPGGDLTAGTAGANTAGATVSSAGAGAGAGGMGGASGGAGGDVTAAGTAADMNLGGMGGEPYTEDPGDEGDGDFTVGPNYGTDPDLTDQGNPRGRSFQFSLPMADSAIFNGDDSTLDPNKDLNPNRRIDVYVPALYQDGDEAPLLVIHDGPGRIGPISRALDNLTISDDPDRRLPVFIAIAVQNGGSDSKGSERGLEYDTMSDREARFINDEVLQAVLNNPEIKAAYPNIAFTENPWGKGALGCSSGGAAALTMGWFRPDLFRRLITYSGTFVDQQDDDAAEEAEYPLGAWEYHSSLKLIENNDQKPLRIFIHASENDNGANAPESGHHNWVMANQRTAAALAAKGYHYRFVYSLNTGHCDGKVFNETLADTLVWMWRGYHSDAE